MFCQKCGTQLPDNAVFCSRCGNPTGAGGGGAPAPAAASAPSSAPIIADAGVKELKCPACGAPIQPTFGDTVVTCEYCGSSVTLGGQGWKGIKQHSMLPLKVTDPNQALQVVHGWVDQGFFHRHDFEKSQVGAGKLSYVPFWVMPANASTTVQYQDVAASVGSTVGTMVAAEMLGSALGGNRRGGFVPVPIMTGPVVNPTRSETVSNHYEFPVIAVKAMGAYQPKEYQFGLTERTAFDKKSIPDQTSILNGDVPEDSAKSAAQSYVQQLQSELAHKRHPMVSSVNSQVTVEEGELLHVPLWLFDLDQKGTRRTIVVDAHAGRVIRTV